MRALKEFWINLKMDETKTPLAVAIPKSRVDPNGGLGAILEPRKSYFQVRVNQLFLATQRQWNVKIAPMVLTVSEFTFAGKRSTVPFVVGPGKLEGLGVKEPRGMVYRDTRVAGLHPYAGGTISLAVVLCRVPVDNVADRFLRVIESTSQAIDYASMLVPYLKIGQVILDGVSQLFALGTTRALLGWRQEFDRDSDTRLMSGFFALVDNPAPEAKRLWVKDRQLHEGATLEEAVPYRKSDFVLFSITQPPDGIRTDLDELPIADLWRRVKEEAVVQTADGEKSFQANWTALEQSILLSPDLTEPQKEALADEYWETAKKIRARAQGRAQRDGTHPKKSDKAARVRSRSLRSFAITH